MNTSSSTPSGATKKTAWARKPAFALVTALAAAAAVVAIIGAWLIAKNNIIATLGNAQFALRVVDAPADLQKGLSGVTYLPPSQGMLFVFSTDGRWPIWMKDMYINIDIIWLDADKQVVWMVENASPASFPDSFIPSTNARYVIELPAGAVQRAQITQGSQAAFTLP